MEIRLALPGESGLLTDLAVRSKGYWSYDKKALEVYRTHLEVNEEDIADNLIYVGCLSNAVIGFYGLSSNELQRLYFLFVEPEYIGKGLGFQLWSHALKTVKNRKWQSITFYADQFAAQKFYYPLGCINIGEMNSELGGKLVELRYGLSRSE